MMRSPWLDRMVRCTSTASPCSTHITNHSCSSGCHCLILRTPCRKCLGMFACAPALSCHTTCRTCSTCSSCPTRRGRLIKRERQEYWKVRFGCAGCASSSCGTSTLTYPLCRPATRSAEPRMECHRCHRTCAFETASTSHTLSHKLHTPTRTTQRTASLQDRRIARDEKPRAGPHGTVHLSSQPLPHPHHKPFVQLCVSLVVPEQAVPQVPWHARVRACVEVPHVVPHVLQALQLSQAKGVPGGARDDGMRSRSAMSHIPVQTPTAHVVPSDNPA